MSPQDERELLTKVREIHAAMLARRTANASPPCVNIPPSAPRPVAKHDPNDPTVKLLPKNWRGEDLRGRRYSECPPNFLGMLSHMLDSFADKNEADPERQRYAKWDRENAVAARTWRARLEPQQSLPGSSVDELIEEGAL